MVHEVNAQVPRPAVIFFVVGRLVILYPDVNPKSFEDRVVIDGPAVLSVVGLIAEEQASAGAHPVPDYRDLSVRESPLRADEHKHTVGREACGSYPIGVGVDGITLLPQVAYQLGAHICTVEGIGGGPVK